MASVIPDELLQAVRGGQLTPLCAQYQKDLHLAQKETDAAPKDASRPLWKQLLGYVVGTPRARALDNERQAKENFLEQCRGQNVPAERDPPYGEP